jgi:hypothetical protein
VSAAAVVAAVAPLTQNVPAMVAAATVRTETAPAFPARRQKRTRAATTAVEEAQVNNTASAGRPTKRITRSASHRSG